MNPSTHVIIITAYGTVDKAVEALKGGAIDFIEKPFKVKKIQEIIKRISIEKKFDKSKMILVEKSLESIIKREDFIELFKRNLVDGNGLCVSTHSAEYVKETYDLKNIEIIELKDMRSKTEFDEKKIQKTIDDIYNFIQNNPQSIVLMDGFEFFMDHFTNNFIEKFLSGAYQKLLKNDSKMILYVNTNKLHSKELDNLVSIINNVMVSIGMNCLSNPIEIDIVEYLMEFPDSTFNDIFQNINLDKSSKLSFYLQKLHSNQIINKEDKKYSLGPKGEIMIKTLDIFKNIEIENYQNSLLIICEK
jgi:hypothetical protein